MHHASLSTLSVAAVARAGLDNDVHSKAHTNGLLFAIEYLPHGGVAVAPDGRPAAECAVLCNYHFSVNRQFVVIAEGGDVGDVWPLPFQTKVRRSLRRDPDERSECSCAITLSGTLASRGIAVVPAPQRAARAATPKQHDARR